MNWQQARAMVALEALSVPEETTISTLCPVCNGGQSGEKKLSVTRTHNGALFVCFRAACGFRGFVATGESGSKDMPRRPAPPRPFQRSTKFYKGRGLELVQTYSGFREGFPLEGLEGWGLSWDGDDRVYECRGFRGELLGHVTRSPDKVIKTFRAREGVSMYSVYALPGGSGRAVIVEDPISAMCVASHGWTGVALLGTNVPDGVDEWLRECPPKRLFFWLDPDAEGKALKMSGKYKGAAAVMGYDKDPKDLPELGEILSSYAK